MLHELYHRDKIDCGEKLGQVGVLILHKIAPPKVGFHQSRSLSIH